MDEGKVDKCEDNESIDPEILREAIRGKQMSTPFKDWIESKKKERYKLFEIVRMSGIPWSTFRLHRNPGVKMSKKTALKIHKATGISMENLGFAELWPDKISNEEREFAAGIREESEGSEFKVNSIIGRFNDAGQSALNKLRSRDFNMWVEQMIDSGLNMDEIIKISGLNQDAFFECRARK